LNAWPKSAQNLLDQVERARHHARAFLHALGIRKWASHGATALDQFGSLDDI
jgi:NAD-dependent DNA ligase